MYEKLTKEDIRDKYSNDIYEFSVDETKFICNKGGLLFRKMKSGNWKMVKNTENHTKGYNVIIVNKKQYSRAKLILFAFNKINLDDKNRNIYHLNLDRLDCDLENLTLEVP